MNPFHHAAALVREIDVSGALDIAFMSLVIYTLLVWFKRTKAGFVLTGILIVSGVYVLARALNMVLTASVLQGFFAVILVAVVVIFQEELRHFFERVAVWSLESKLPRRRTSPETRRQVEVIARTLTDLARERIGAIIVLRGRDALVRHLDGGTPLDGAVSEPLLKSIFDPHSIGHDGAVVVEGDRVTCFSAHLPLSKDLKKLEKSGTRHAAALGLSELTDAMCLVVSEERGTISVARNGDIREVRDPNQLMPMLGGFYDSIAPRQDARSGLQEFFSSNYREKAIAVVVTVLLWFVLVHESVVIYRTYTVPVRYANLPQEWQVTDIRPENIHVTFSGPRRSFFFLGEEDIRARLKLFNVREGTTTIAVTASDLSFPSKIQLENIEPPTVRLHVEPKTQEQK